MDTENARREESIRAPRGEAVAADGAFAEEPLEEALLTRLERIVVLAGRRGDRALHDELLDELRGLVREAESLRPSSAASEGEVVERPARRLHGT